eukprot:5784960-Pyramimonas_sp.AAC.1
MFGVVHGRIHLTCLSRFARPHHPVGKRCPGVALGNSMIVPRPTPLRDRPQPLGGLHANSV